MEPISILIVDDHAVVRAGVRGFLSIQPDFLIVGEAENGVQAVEMTQQHTPDVVLMDLVMPAMNGIEATRLVKEASPRTQVIILTSHHDDTFLFPALQAGALSYILKDVPPSALVEAVRRAAQGEATLTPQIATRVLQALQSRDSASGKPFAELTDREREVLYLIAEGTSNAQIADKLVVSEKTVKGHVSNILSKLHLADRTQAAVLAWKKGFMKND